MIALIDLPFQKTSSNFSTSSSDYYLSFPLQIQNPRILSIFICSLQHDEVQIAFPMTKIFDLFLYSIKEKGKERSLLEISDQQHLSVVLVFIQNHYFNFNKIHVAHRFNGDMGHFHFLMQIFKIKQNDKLHRIILFCPCTIIITSRGRHFDFFKRSFVLNIKITLIQIDISESSILP